MLPVISPAALPFKTGPKYCEHYSLAAEIVGAAVPLWPKSFTAIPTITKNYATFSTSISKSMTQPCRVTLTYNNERLATRLRF